MILTGKQERQGPGLGLAAWGELRAPVEAGWWSIAGTYCTYVSRTYKIAYLSIASRLGMTSGWRVEVATTHSSSAPDVVHDEAAGGRITTSVRLYVCRLLSNAVRVQRCKVQMQATSATQQGTAGRRFCMAMAGGEVVH